MCGKESTILDRVKCSDVCKVFIFWCGHQIVGLIWKESKYDHWSFDHPITDASRDHAETTFHSHGRSNLEPTLQNSNKQINYFQYPSSSFFQLLIFTLLVQFLQSNSNQILHFFNPVIFFSSTLLLFFYFEEW